MHNIIKDHGLYIYNILNKHRAWAMFLMKLTFIDFKSMDEKLTVRLLMILGFLIIANGVCLIMKRYMKPAILAQTLLIIPLILYEMNNVENSVKRAEYIDKGLDKIDAIGGINLNKMLSLHNEIIYPIHYQILRIFDYIVILSGMLYLIIINFKKNKNDKQRKDMDKEMQKIREALQKKKIKDSKKKAKNTKNKKKQN